ncbi:MAG: hypothetical protein B7Z66_09660 [Chromatiales bacterium 21-64-14]|nr:MAG: hypothetical protein B7Z66_09660 [Chromatiales bacterium 21-64-14]HQU16309.1 YceD family protein [Gammaproteobacteria bacterium]
MFKSLPQHFEPLRRVEQGQAYRGQVALSRMDRLGRTLASTEGAVQVELYLDRDEQRIAYLHGRIEARLSLVCQRCLEPMGLEVDREILLGLVRSDEEADRLPMQYEPLLVTPGPMAVSEIIEDELILALPIVALHGDGEPCMAYTPARAEEEQDATGSTEDPFAMLKELKRRD